MPHPGTAGPRGWGFTPSIGSSPGDGKPQGVGRSPIRGFGLRRTRMGDDGSGRGPRGLAGGHPVTGARTRHNGGLKVRSTFCCTLYSGHHAKLEFPPFPSLAFDRACKSTNYYSEKPRGVGRSPVLVIRALSGTSLEAQNGMYHTAKRVLYFDNA